MLFKYKKVCKIFWDKYDFKIIALTVLMKIASMARIIVAAGHGVDNAFGYTLSVPEAE